jgi:SAM-dependent methyltransferase
MHLELMGLHDKINPREDYWESFYASTQGEQVPRSPTPFAQWVLRRMALNQSIIEFGCGNGRDSLWFAANGHAVRGFDFAPSAVQLASKLATNRGLQAKFEVLDLRQRPAVDALAIALAATRQRPAVYARFLLNSLDDHGRRNLLHASRELLCTGGELYVEFRTHHDAHTLHVFGEQHFRAYLNPDLLVSEIHQLGGFVVYQHEGRGLAAYRTEDPHVARVVAQWATTPQ